jgi:hypothetical protein
MIISTIMKKKYLSMHKPSPEQQKRIDIFATLFICGILGLIITLLFVLLTDIDPNGVTFFV